MDFLLQLIVLMLAMISFQHEFIAQQVLPSNSVVVPIAKHVDSSKDLYSAKIMTKYVNSSQFIYTNFLIDIEAPFSWYDCIVQWNIHPGSCPDDTICVSPVSCEEYQCTDVRTSTFYRHASCPPVTNSSTLPGWGFCSCPVNVVNPIDGSCSEALLNYDDNWFNVNSACAPSSTFELFPRNVSGVLALSSSSYAVPAYLFYTYDSSFALCLPNTVSSTGVLFIGSGPYYLQTRSRSSSYLEVRSLLSYTPLLKHQDSFGYFIRVDTIVIKTRSIAVPANATTKISTIVPYTTLRTDIYNQLVCRFSKVTKRLRPAKPVAPFGLCFKIFNGTGLKVPDVDFGLPDGKKWTVSTANSMKQVTKDVACLAFVDGGATSEHVIVIGTFQMEDNFVRFDLVNSTLGFSSSLLNKGTSCSSFNFTGI